MLLYHLYGSLRQIFITVDTDDRSSVFSEE